MMLWLDPNSPLGGFLQTVSTRLAVDASTTNTTWTTLISVSVTTGGNSSIVINASFSVSNVSNDDNQNYLRVTVDGAEIAEGGNEEITAPQTGGFNLETVAKVDAGAHTVALEWKTVASGTIRCRASSLPAPEHASLVVAELGV